MGPGRRSPGTGVRGDGGQGADRRGRVGGVSGVSVVEDLRQEVLGAVTARIAEELVRSRIQDHLGSEVQISFEYPEDIPRERSGKYRWLISKVESQGLDRDC